eukprot:gene16780-34870_t
MTSAESSTHPSSPAPAVGREHAIDALRGRAEVTDKKVGVLGFCLGGKLAYLAACRTDADAVV